MTNKEDKSLCKAEDPSTCISPVEFVGDPVNCKSSWTFQAGVHHNLNENKKKKILSEIKILGRKSCPMHYPFTNKANFQKAKAWAEQCHIRENIKDLEVQIRLLFGETYIILCLFKLQIQTLNSVCLIYSNISLAVCAKSIPKEHDSRSKCRT